MTSLKNIYLLIKSITYKKDKSIIVFGSWFGHRFADNTRYLFQYLSENKERLGLSRVVWISRDQKIIDSVNSLGYEACKLGSLESIELHKSAYYHICNNAPVDSYKSEGELDGAYSYRSKRINLWHGTGAIKTFNMATNEYRRKVSRHPFLYMIKNSLYSFIPLFRALYGVLGGWGDCYYLTTSISERNKFRKCYPLPEDNFIISGYPRDSYKNLQLLPDEKVVLQQLNKYKYSILYLPTFRSENSKFDFLNVSIQLSEVLKEKDILFIQKAHLVDAPVIDEKITTSGNILSLPSEFDINVLTPHVTFVMTDYSSILADALYHKIPILLYVPDYYEYMSGERGFSDDAEEILSAGKKYFQIQELVKDLQEHCDDTSYFIDKNYYSIREKVWCCEKNIEEIWTDIVSQIK